MNQRSDSGSTLERRAAAQFEVREDAKTIRVVGHAAVFNQDTDIGGFFREIIAPGAFSGAIRRDDVPFLIEHADLPLARTRSGTLKLSEDNIGLRIEAELDPEDPDVRRIVPKMKRGDLDKMSFAFRAMKQAWDETTDPPTRTIQEVELFDVSIVTSPAYEGTDIALRSLDEKREAAKQQAVEAERERSRQNFVAAAFRTQKTIGHDLTQREKEFAAARDRRV